MEQQHQNPDSTAPRALLCFRSPCQTPSSTFQTSKRALPASCSSVFSFLIRLKEIPEHQFLQTSAKILANTLKTFTAFPQACSLLWYFAFSPGKADIWKAELSKCTPANQSIHLAKSSAQSHFCRAIQMTLWGFSLRAQRCSTSAASLCFLSSHSGVIILGRKPINWGWGGRRGQRTRLEVPSKVCRLSCMRSARRGGQNYFWTKVSSPRGEELYEK